MSDMKKLRPQNSQRNQTSITLIRELHSGHRLRSAKNYLSALDAPSLAMARFQDIRCGHCGGRINLRVASVARGGTTSGKRAWFAHAAGLRAACTVFTGKAQSSTEVEATRFHGKQEGLRHLSLKIALADAISTDPAFESAAIEVRIDHDSNYRRPDVIGETQHGMMCFDLQLASPMRETIKGRRNFYTKAGLAHLWVIDGTRLDKASLQGFQDLVWQSNGLILAWDEDCESESHERGELVMKLVTINDAKSHISSSWQWISREDIFAIAGFHKDHAMARDLTARGFFDLLAKGDRPQLEAYFNLVLRPQGFGEWRDLCIAGLLPVVGAISSVFKGEVSDGSARMPNEIGAVINTALNTTLRDGRHIWAPLIKSSLSLQEASRGIEKFGPKTRQVIDRAIAAGNAAEFQARLAVWRPLLTRLFPTLPLI